MKMLRRPSFLSASISLLVNVPRSWLLLLATFTSLSVVHAQSNYLTPYKFTTLAGDTLTGSTNGTGNAARFNSPSSTAVDTAGNVYVADLYNHTIRKISASGVVTTLAGSPGDFGSSDGTGSAARFYGPTGVAVDVSGNVYVTDRGNNTIRKITAAGVVTTLAGTAGDAFGSTAGSTDGTGVGARFDYPFGIAVDASGNVYVADANNWTIRKITSAGVVTTLAGLAGHGGSANGTGSSARFGSPTGVAVDGSGNVYVTDAASDTIRKITAGGTVTTFAGSAGIAGAIDGSGTSARFNIPFGVAVDNSGNVYITDRSNETIRKITSAGVVTTIAGTAGIAGSIDGSGSTARFFNPIGIAVDASGVLYVADTANQSIRKITAGVVSTFAGPAGNNSTIDGTGNAARFDNLSSVAVDASGTLYAADVDSYTIRKITSAGIVTTLAGNAGSIGNSDGTGNAARLHAPRGVAVDTNGNVYFSDYNRVRKINSFGVVTTLAGSTSDNGSSIGANDGTGSAARFNNPTGVTVDVAGNIYVADSYNHIIRKITPAAVVTTFAGTAGSIGSTDGTGSAARFNYPEGIAIDGAGNLYVADTYNHTIRKITPAGAVTTLAGGVGASGTTDGVGSVARFNTPSKVAVDGRGNLYVADTLNHLIRKITPAGIVTTVGGIAGINGRSNGVGSAASFNSPEGVAVDAAGNLYIADTLNNTIRKGTPPVSINGDFDADFKADVLWRNNSSGAVASWTSAGGFTIFGSESGGWSVIGKGDFDGDLKADVLWHNTSTGLVASWTSTNGYKVYGSESSGWAAIGTGDFDGDGKADVLWHNTSTGLVASWTSTNGYQVYGSESSGWSVIGTGDFDGDGKADVLWHNTSSSVVASWTSTNGYKVYGTEGSGWAVIGTGDYDGDGKADVLWHNTSSGLVASWASTDGYKVYGAESGGWLASGTGDYDGDGKADVLWRNTSTGVVASWTSTIGYQVYGTEGGGWATIN